MKRNSALEKKLILWLIGVVMVFGGCAAEEVFRPTEIDLVRDQFISLRGLELTGVSVTGIGCGLNEREALSTARRIAHFNLRGVVGARLRKINFTVLREVPEFGEHCVEVMATRSS